MPYKVGESVSRIFRVTEQDIMNFAWVSGDTNPVHLDRDFAKKTIFGGRVAHGVLFAGWASAMLGSQLPGPGAILTSISNLQFKLPVRPGDEITIDLRIIDLKRKNKGLQLTLNAIGTNQRDEVVAEGDFVVLAPHSQAG